MAGGSQMTEQADSRRRALRRHHRDRVRRYIERMLMRVGFAPREHVCRYINTRVPCSCWMCGNPRRHLHERTRQERPAELDQRQMLGEL